MPNVVLQRPLEYVLLSAPNMTSHLKRCQRQGLFLRRGFPLLFLLRLQALHNVTFKQPRTSYTNEEHIRVPYNERETFGKTCDKC
jgi:hypothetical protein